MKQLRVFLLTTLAVLTSLGLYAADGLYVVSDAVGVNTDSPDEPLHVFGDAGNAQVLVEETSGTTARRRLFQLENNGPPEFTLVDTSRPVTWKFGTRVDNFEINLGGSGKTEFLLKSNGDLQIQGALVQVSSRAAKDRFEPVDPRMILDRVVEMPLLLWNYKDDSDSNRHLGPMAEDFHAAFGLGADTGRLAPSDTAGVALAAVQGLNAEVEELRAERDELRQELDEIRAVLDALIAVP